MYINSVDLTVTLCMCADFRLSPKKSEVEGANTSGTQALGVKKKMSIRWRTRPHARNTG